MTTDLFTNTDNKSTAANDQTQDTTNTANTSDQNLLNELVGPGKKFSSVEALAAGKKTSDEFIGRLQSEMQGLREELARRTSAEDIIKQVREELKQSQVVDNQTTSLDEQTVAKIVQSQLSEANRQTAVEQNLIQVREALLTQYGTDESAKTAIATKAQELGVTVEYLRDNAAQAPKAFLALMGVTGKQKQVANGVVSDLQKNSQNTEALPQTANAQQIKEHYDNLRRTNPTKYWAPATQKEIWSLMQQGKYGTEQ